VAQALVDVKFSAAGHFVNPLLVSEPAERGQGAQNFPVPHQFLNSDLREELDSRRHDWWTFDASRLPHLLCAVLRHQTGEHHTDCAGYLLTGSGAASSAMEGYDACDGPLHAY
jgi:hypothetical protein